MTRQMPDIVMVGNDLRTITEMNVDHGPGLWRKFKSLFEPAAMFRVYPSAKELGMQTQFSNTALRRQQLHLFEISETGELTLRWVFASLRDTPSQRALLEERGAQPPKLPVQLPTTSLGMSSALRFDRALTFSGTLKLGFALGTNAPDSWSEQGPKLRFADGMLEGELTDDGLRRYDPSSHQAWWDSVHQR